MDKRVLGPTQDIRRVQKEYFSNGPLADRISLATVERADILLIATNALKLGPV